MPPPLPPAPATDEAAPGGIEKHRFPCPACGSDMRFRPGGMELLCDHCGHEEAIEAPGGARLAEALRELDFAEAARGGLPEAQMETTRTVHCDSCGANVELGEAGTARECPFCGSPLVAGAAAHRHVRPSAVLPFKVTEEAARRHMTDWLGGLWFAPNGLRDYARKGRRMQGIYVPYWTFDAATATRYSGQRGDDYWTTERRVRNGKTETVRVRKTRWRSVSGHVSRAFDDVLVVASRSLPVEHTDALEPWDLGALRTYLPAYLAGFRAEGYSVPIEEGFGVAKGKMETVIRGDIRSDIGGDHQRISGLSTEHRQVTFKHILLPVWLAAYKFRGESFRFVVNGRTGEVKGERPWSKWKIAFAVLVAAILAGVFAYFYGTYG
ncbi:primosomal protein N' (replication factor Y) - superfamily II helicase [Roseicyclus sp. F158]|uniref:Primosomal protein N' (Replication factor Y) -superfamily II helicase n=1 Tax=Tropicimonas omnivorans TaxID=3075590 RepID=A0ABU3DFM6_9RHOB|nr:primosomal protein N' (replication factor Y) - superfamily II helicase [Roseicyclus sp. F158]MDT0682510.1 primosomal protein N' (replication factor Y) - superfamily II helicase [Roseicyclus sp. F158]